MKSFAKIAAAAVIALGASTLAANAACNGDASTETVLGAGSGAFGSGDGAGPSFSEKIIPCPVSRA